MSEHLKHRPEHDHKSEQLKNLEHDARKNLERLHEEAEKAKDKESQRDISEIHKTIEEKARSAKEISVHGHPEAREDAVLGVQQELKADAYKKTPKTIQKELKPTERTFSKVIHQPLVETISNVSEKTIARPSALLGGGVMALLGSSLVLYMSKHYGFAYNTFLFFLLFVVGFVVGVAIEFALRAVSRRRSS